MTNEERLAHLVKNMQAAGISGERAEQFMRSRLVSRLAELDARIDDSFDKMRKSQRRMLRSILGLGPDSIGPVIQDRDPGDEHDPSVIREVVAEVSRSR